MLLINTFIGPHRGTIIVLEGKPASIYYVELETMPEFIPEVPLLALLMPPLCHLLISVQSFRYSVLTDTQTD